MNLKGKFYELKEQSAEVQPAEHVQVPSSQIPLPLQSFKQVSATNMNKNKIKKEVRFAYVHKIE
jgi:hypothetical protein